VSWRASAYVKKLLKHPDGTALTRTEKCVLYTIADYHNTETRCAWCGFATIARESLITRRHLQTILKSIEEHGTLEIVRRTDEFSQTKDNNLYFFIELERADGAVGYLEPRNTKRPLDTTMADKVYYVYSFYPDSPVRTASRTFRRLGSSCPLPGRRFAGAFRKCFAAVGRPGPGRFSSPRPKG
jgi:predicted DNA binding protein